jgi:hypothetical protein
MIISQQELAKEQEKEKILVYRASSLFVSLVFSNRFREANRLMMKNRNLLASLNLLEITNHGDARCNPVKRGTMTEASAPDADFTVYPTKPYLLSWLSMICSQA